MRAIILALAVASLAGGTAIADSPSIPVPKVVTDPNWLEKPSQDDMAWAYPHAALIKGIGAMVRLNCAVTVQARPRTARSSAKIRPPWVSAPRRSGFPIASGFDRGRSMAWREAEPR